MASLFRRFIREETGATAIEYALLAGLLAIALVTSMTLMGSRLSAKFTQLGNQLS